MPIETSVGFTGTRQGYNALQATQVSRIVRLFIGQFHDGWAVGADEQVAQLVDRMGGFTLHAHYPKNPKFRSAFKPRHALLVEYPEKDYADRDLDIVQASQFMIATPAQEREIGRGSGTWLTIRMARVELNSLAIIFPDGKTKYERWPKSVRKP